METPQIFPEIEWYRDIVNRGLPSIIDKYSDIFEIDDDLELEENLNNFLDNVQEMKADTAEKYLVFLLFLVTLFSGDNEQEFDANIKIYHDIIVSRNIFPQLAQLNNFRVAYEEAIQIYLKYHEEDRNKLTLLEEDLETFPEPAFTIERRKVDSVSFEVELSVPDAVKDIISFLDTFPCNETFPVLWIHPDKTANIRGHLKVYSGISPDLRFTDRYVSPDILYIQIKFSERKTIIGEIYTESVEDKRVFKMQITLDDGSRFNDMQDIFSNLPAPFAIPDITGSASKAFFTYSIKYTEVESSLFLENFVTAVTINGTLARYFSIRETSNPPTSKSIRMRYNFPFYYPGNKSINFLLQGNLLTKKRGAELFSDASSVMSSSSLTSELEEDDNRVIDIRLQGEREEDVAKYVPTIALIIQYYLEDLQYAVFGPLLSLYVDITAPAYIVRTDASRRESTIARSRKSSRLTSTISSRRAQTVASINMFDYFEQMDSKTFEDKIRSAVLGSSKEKFSFSNICQIANQPRILKPNKIKEWENLQFVWNDTIYNRLALPFPSIDKPQFYLGSPSPTHPFIGLRMSGQRLFPCCYDEDQNIPGKKLYKYLNGQTTEHTVPMGLRGNVIDNISVQEAGQRSVIPVALEEYLTTIDSIKKYNKVGVPIGKNSILHCCFLATSIEYRNIFAMNITVTEKNARLNDFVRRQLEEFFASDEGMTVTNLIADAKIDVDFHDVVGMLTRTDRYIDPRIFAKLLEYYFSCRLLLFIADKNTVEYVEPNYFIAPSGFPARTLVPSVQRHEGNEKKTMDTIICLGQMEDDTYQWELVYWSDDIKSNIYTFPESIGSKLTSSIITAFRLNQITFEKGTMARYDPVGLNIELLIRVMEDNQIFVSEQFLDSVGKCRVIRLQSDTDDFFVQISPSRPFAVPIMTDIPINKTLSGYYILEQMMGSPTNIFIDRDLIWKFSWHDGTGNNYIEYHVRKRADNTKPFDLTQPNIIEKAVERHSINRAKTYIDLHKTARRFEKIIIYLFIQYLIDRDITSIEEGQTHELVDRFAKYWVIDPEVYYNFQILRGSFPVRDSFDETMAELEETGLTSGPDIIFDSEELVRRMRLILIRWTDNRIHANLTDYLLDTIPGFYEYSSDFDQTRGTRVYIGGTDFSSPVQIYRNEIKNMKPPKVINGPFKYVSLVYPCPTLDDELQNRAQMWRLEKINLNLSDDERLLGKPKTKIMKKEEIEYSIGMNEKEPMIYILEEDIGKKKKYSVLLPLSSDN